MLELEDWRAEELKRIQRDSAITNLPTFSGYKKKQIEVVNLVKPVNEHSCNKAMKIVS